MSRLHLTFLLYLIWIAAARYLAGGPQAAIQGVLFISLLFLCVLLYPRNIGELMMVEAARPQGGGRVPRAATRPDEIPTCRGAVSRREPQWRHRMASSKCGNDGIGGLPLEST